MNNLKLEKPLIEWEKELDVWLIDLDLKEHLISYNKMDAFSKIFVSNVRRGWQEKHYNLYYSILLNKSLDTLVLDEFKNSFMYDNCDAYDEKPLIEWERQKNVWISDIDIEEHFKNYYRYKADLKLKKYANIFPWNDYAQSVYDSYKGVNVNKEENKDKVESLKIEDNINIPSSINNDSIYIDNNSVIDNLFKKKKRGEFHRKYKPVKVRKSGNIKKIKNNIVKKAVALALILSTSVFAMLCSKLFFKNNDDSFDNSFNVSCKADNIKRSLDNHMAKGSVENSYNIMNDHSNIDIITSENENYIDVNNNLSLENDVIVEDAIDCNDIIDSNDTIVKDDLDNINSYIQIGDVVSIDDDADIYTNCFDAMNSINGLNPYYSYDYDRTVIGICLNYKDNVLYSSDNDEVDNYIDDGATIVSYSTMVNDVNEGFYEASNVI